MKYKLGFTEEETYIEPQIASTLFNASAGDMQTLISPSNLQFLFEKYKQGDLHTISNRFSSNKTNPLTNKQVDAIYKYLVFITEKGFETGGFGNST